MNPNPQNWHESGDIGYIEPLPMPTISVYCCREWIVIPFMGWGTCGDCGRKPEKREQ